MKHITAFVAVSLAIWALPPASLAAREAERPDALVGTAATAASSAPRLDVVFCVDTTGSMSDEIDVVKRKMREMIANIAVGHPTPDVRFGLVIYRDRGDEYVTKRYDLTSDIDAVVEYINEIQATGGNDYPESMNEALHVAVQEMNWDPGASVGRSIFLIADAPPHLDYENDYNYRDEAAEALGKGIVIDTIGCSGLEEKDQPLFEEIANIASGSFELLTYMREYVKADGEKGVVMSAGGELYALTTPAASDEWREGATVLARRGQAEKLAEADVAGDVVAAAAPAGLDRSGMLAPGYVAEGEPSDRFFGAYAARAGGPGGAAGATGDAGRPAAGEYSATHAARGYDRADVGKPLSLTAGGSASLAEGANNLDVLLTRRLQYQLAQQGVRFADQPYLPRAEWQGGSCAQEQRRAMVARSQTEWQAIWALIAGAEGRDEPPAVDFSRDMVLAAFGGVNWKGRTLRIEDVWEDDTGLHALVKRGPDDPEAAAPYHVLVVSRYEGKIVWK